MISTILQHEANNISCNSIFVKGLNYIGENAYFSKFGYLSILTWREMVALQLRIIALTLQSGEEFTNFFIGKFNFSKYVALIKIHS